MSNLSLAQLNWLDYAIIGIILFSLGISVLRGFMREACSLATWLLAVVITARFSPAASDLLTQWIDTPALRMVTAGIALFVMVWIIGALSTFLIGQLVDVTGLSKTDRLIGAVFGLARGILVVSALILLGSVTTAPHKPWWSQSVLIPDFNPFVHTLQHLLPKEMVALKQLGNT